MSNMDKQFSRLSPSVVVAGISVQDTNNDIRHFLQSRLGDLPVDDVNEQQDLARRILLKSQGCFLWVRLVLQELEHIYEETTIATVLDEMPSEMSQFYDRTVDFMTENIREKDVAKSILRWSVVGTRSLTVSELQQALKFDIGANVRSIEKSIEGLCGQLVVVDNNGLILMVHQTARGFLLRNRKSDFGI
ncbi:hypothetical protein NHQ30_006466 [Ciborinia camelliae]|nr:hypothetical protein NHQ30_006466 [Ciborinia camelliae]